MTAGRWRRSVVAAMAFGVTAGLMSASDATGPAPSGYSVLQINICNSGFACDLPDTEVRAAELIAARRPSAVTVNEMCRSDLAVIEKRSGYADLGTFTQSGSRRCRNGSPFGNTLLFPPRTDVTGYEVTTYTAQNGDSERRTLACARAEGVTTCVTHLLDGQEERPRRIRADQARQMREVLGRHAARGPTVLGGDWNLVVGGTPDARDFVPAGMVRTGDGDVQHVLATSAHFRFERANVMEFDWTDHPGLHVHYMSQPITAGSTSVRRC